MSATPSGYAKDQPSGFLNRIERVAIVGAGGHVGRHLTEHLLATQKHVVTAITRPNSTSELTDIVNVLRIDYSSEAKEDVVALVDALRGQQVLLVTMSHNALNTNRESRLRSCRSRRPIHFCQIGSGHDAANEKIDRGLLDDGVYTNNVREVERLGVQFFISC